MKKIGIIVLCILLTGCTEITEPDPIPDEVIIDEKGPTLIGVEDVSVAFGSDFDPMYGVSAVDVFDGNITSDIEVENEVNTNAPGIYLLRYRVSDSDQNETIKLRYVDVSNPPVDSINNLIFNGDFTMDMTGYYVYQVDGQGHGTFTVSNDMLRIELESIEEGTWYRPRLHTEGITLLKGSRYLVAFDGKADDARLVQVQVGELLSEDPWFDKMDGQWLQFELTNEWNEFSFEFEMTKDTNYNVNVLFEFGDIIGDKTLTTLYLDNIRVYRID